MGNNLNGEKANLNIKRTAAQTAVLMAVLTLVSKLFGFIREMILAACFGTSYVVDAYVMAQNIPNILFAGVLAAVSTSFMPVLSEKSEKEGLEQSNSFVNDVLNMLQIIAIILVLFGLLFAPQFVEFFAPGFERERELLTVFFLRITFIYIVFNSANSLLTSYLQYKGVFLPQIAFGYVQNLIVITFIIIAASFDEKLLVFGLLISYFVIYVLLTRLAVKYNFKRKYSLKTSQSAKEVVKLALPVFIGGYVTQINTYVDKVLASNLPEGSIAALNYALLIVSLITGLTVTIISTIVFPRLNQAKALNNQKQYNILLGKSFNLTAIIAIPFGLGAMAFSDEVVQVIYERGAFNETATTMTSVALLWYGPHLIVSSLNTIVTQAFHSNKDMKTPVYIGLSMVIINIILNIVFVRLMGLGGLPLATSVTGTIGLIIGGITLNRKFQKIKLIESYSKLIKVFVSSIVAIGFALLFDGFLTSNLWMPRTLYLGSDIFVAGITYLLLLYFFKIDEIEFIKNIVKR